MAIKEGGGDLYADFAARGYPFSFLITNDDLSARHACFFYSYGHVFFYHPFFLFPHVDRSFRCSVAKGKVQWRYPAGACRILPLLHCGSCKHSTHPQGIPPQGRHGRVHWAVHHFLWKPEKDVVFLCFESKRGCPKNEQPLFDICYLFRFVTVIEKLGRFIFCQLFTVCDFGNNDKQNWDEEYGQQGSSQHTA